MRASASTHEGPAWTGAANALADNPADVPFALLYALATDSRGLELKAAFGLLPEITTHLANLDLTDTSSPWPIAEVFAAGRPVVRADLTGVRCRRRRRRACPARGSG